MDISACNAYVLFNTHPPAQGIDNSSRARFKFLCSLGEQLFKPNMLLRARYPNDLNLPTKNALKVFGVAVASKIYKGVKNRHKNVDASYVHAKEIEKWNNNTLNAIITGENNIQKNCFIVVTALKRRLKIEHLAELFLRKYNTFWLFLGYRDILIVVFI